MENLSLEQLITKGTNVKEQITRFSNYLDSKKCTQLTLDEAAEFTCKLDQWS